MNNEQSAQHRVSKTEFYGLLTEYEKIDPLLIPPILKNYMLGFFDWLQKKQSAAGSQHTAGEICKCGHSKDAHAGKSAMWQPCYEDNCNCQDFRPAAGSQVSTEDYTTYWFNDEQFVPEWQARQLQQRVAHLRELLAHKTAMVEHLDQIASDAWRAAVTWEHWHYYEEIYGKLMPKDMRNNRPPQLHEYLSRFEQTKTETNGK